MSPRITPSYNAVNRKGLWLVIRQGVRGGVRTVCRYPNSPTAEAAAHEVASALNSQNWREL